MVAGRTGVDDKAGSQSVWLDVRKKIHTPGPGCRERGRVTCVHRSWGVMRGMVNIVWGTRGAQRGEASVWR